MEFVYAGTQVQHGVVFKTYEVRVDRMTVLRGNMTEEDALFANLTATATPVISLVVFRSAAVASHPKVLILCSLRRSY